MKTLDQYSLQKYNEIKSNIDNEYDAYLNNIKIKQENNEKSKFNFSS